MDKIWIVYKGELDDRMVAGVFSKKELAEKCSIIHSDLYDEAYIQEYDVINDEQTLDDDYELGYICGIRRHDMEFVNARKINLYSLRKRPDELSFPIIKHLECGSYDFDIIVRASDKNEAIKMALEWIENNK